MDNNDSPARASLITAQERRDWDWSTINAILANMDDTRAVSIDRPWGEFRLSTCRKSFEPTTWWDNFFILDIVAAAQEILGPNRWGDKTHVALYHNMPEWSLDTGFVGLGSAYQRTAPVRALSAKGWRKQVTLICFHVNSNHFMACAVYGPARVIIWFDPNGQGAQVHEAFRREFKAHIAWDRQHNDGPADYDGWVFGQEGLELPQQRDFVSCGPLVCAFCILVTQGLLPSWKALRMASQRLPYNGSGLRRSLISLLLAFLFVKSPDGQSAQREDHKRLLEARYNERY